MNLYVVGERHSVAKQAPFLRMFSDVLSQRGSQLAIESLDLAVGLRMIRRREDVAYAENSENVLKESGCKLCLIVGQQLDRRSVHEYPMVNEGLRDVRG